MLHKTQIALLAALLLVCGVLPPATAATVPSHTVTLGNCTIGEGETVSFTTISPEFADQELPQGTYAGALTVEITGPIVVEAGGMLSVGTLSVGGTDEASPVLSGTLSDTPLIVVKSGGSLKLTTVSLDLAGDGLLIVQEPGASISLTDTQLPAQVVQWAPPTVNNLYNAPDDIWLEEGTSLTQDQFLSSMMTRLQIQGQELDMELAIAWDFTPYDGRTTGEMTFIGQFLDGNGKALSSLRPLTTTVHWYSPQEITVTDTIWKGEDACSAHFAVLELPEDTQVWGEISSDGGKTWSIWPEFDITDNDQGQLYCNFYEVASTPQHYRIVAEDPWTPSFWASQAFVLPEEIGDDPGGNRGGSTTPNSPDREPTPPVSQTPSEPDAFPAPVDRQEDAASPTPEAEPTPTPAASSQPSQAVTVPNKEPSQESNAPSLPLAMQVFLVALGIVVCVSAAYLLAHKRK